MKKKLLSMILILAMSISTALTGCGLTKTEDNKDIEQNSNVQTSSSGTTEIETDIGSNQSIGNIASTSSISIKDIKQKYGVLDKVEIKPFYNVENTTQFTFHFNCIDIEPCHAITVHTDSKCEASSMVYQINDGYYVNEGLDVVVKPGSPVLQARTEDTSYTWGKAPVYYLSINYDMNANTPIKLDEPIIVPFTIKSKVSTPNLTANISTDGKFEIQWKPVEGAVKYNIYEAYEVRQDSAAYKMTRAECGYVGDHLNLLDTVDSNTLSYDNFVAMDSNVITDGKGHISTQNMFVPSTYYVSAVDTEGNESQYSMAVSSWKYKSQLPKTFDNWLGLKRNESNKVIELPEEVEVTMMDGSKAMYPINFNKISEAYGLATYEYEILGTILTGEFEYQREDKIYPESKLSEAVMNYGVYQVKNDLNIIPENTLNTVNDDAYSNSVVSLDKQVDYPADSKITYDSDILLLRADYENARIVRDGIYIEGKTPLDIQTYKSGSQQIIFYEKEPEETERTNVENSDGTVESLEVPEEINSTNLVEQQIESTNREVEHANEAKIPAVSVIYFADSAEEEYLTLMMIARQEVIDVTAFPSLQNTEYLADVFYKLYYQNPYIISPDRIGYAPEEKCVLVQYKFDTSETARRQAEITDEATKIANEIFKDGMTDEEKVLAIWEYLENNTQYDNNALEKAQATGFVDTAGFEDSFNTYGILCNKVGVCQSYSYTYKLLAALGGVSCVSLTGYLDKTLPHAWNAVNLGGEWYWLDATNNANVTGIPYYMYQTSSEFAKSIDYVLDDEYEIDTKLGFADSTDISKDWYYRNGLYAQSDSELASALVTSYKGGNNTLLVKYLGNPDLTEDVQKSIVQGLYDAGMDQDTILNARFKAINGYFIFVY